LNESFFGFEIGLNKGFSRAKFKSDKRPFKVMGKIAKNLNMKPHCNKKRMIIIL